MTDEAFQARIKAHSFVPAPPGSSPEERTAHAMEFIAKQLGDIAWNLDHLANDQMDSLINNLPASVG